jgi:hypothetical protein
MGSINTQKNAQNVEQPTINSISDTEVNESKFRKKLRISKNPNLPPKSPLERFKIVRSIYEAHKQLPISLQKNSVDPEKAKIQQEYEKLSGIIGSQEPDFIKTIDPKQLSRKLQAIDPKIQCRIKSSMTVCENPENAEIFVDKIDSHEEDVLVFVPMKDDEFKKESKVRLTDGQKEVVFFRAKHFKSDTPKGYLSTKDNFSGKKIDVPNGSNEAFSSTYSQYEPKVPTIAIITNTNPSEINSARKRVLDKIESQIK